MIITYTTGKKICCNQSCNVLIKLTNMGLPAKINRQIIKLKITFERLRH